MALEFDKTNQMGVSFGNPTHLNNIAQKTIVVFINLDTLPANGNPNRLIGKVPGWFTDVYNTAGTSVNSFTFVQNWSVASGIWYTDDNTATTSVRSWAVTYDRGATANDPVFYIDGASVTVNEGTTPNGVVTDDSGNNLYIGPNGATPAIDGLIYAAFVWNRILTAASIAEIHSKRSVEGHEYGLVFHCVPIYANGVQVFEGTALAGANTIPEYMYGTTGTPTNSPVGRADTYMSIRG